MWAESFLKRGVDSSFGITSQSNICFLFNFREEGVEGLGFGIVKHSRLSVVLRGNSNNSSGFFGVDVPCHIFSWHNFPDSRGVFEVVFPTLLTVFILFKREVIDWLISGLITPVGSLYLCLLLLFIFSLPAEPVAPGNSSSQIIPISVSVNGDGEDSSPEDPTHLPDHPDISLSHIVCNMEHHCFIFSKLY